MQKIREFGDEDMLNMVLGNKQDSESDRAVLETDGISFAKENNAAFFEVSAKTGYNVDDAVDTLIHEISNYIKNNEKIANSNNWNDRTPHTKSYHQSSKISSAAETKG